MNSMRPESVSFVLGTPPPLRSSLRMDAFPFGRAPPRVPTDRRIRVVLDLLIDQHDLRIGPLAARFNLSASRLRHLFREQTGQNLSEVLLAGRLIHAAALLTGTELRVKEVAQRVGYDCSTSFARAFRQHFHTSPTRYRCAAQNANH